MSREAERLAARFRPPYKLVIETISGPTSYATGGVEYYSDLLRHVERAACIQPSSPGGWHGEIVTGSISGNAYRLRVWTSGAEAPAGLDLSAEAFTILLEGL